MAIHHLFLTKRAKRSKAYILVGLSLTCGDLHAFKMESDTVVLFDTFTTAQFVTVNFRQTYDVVPLVFALPTDQGGDPSALRIRNVTTTSFEVAQVEPSGNDGPHLSMTVHYFAIEPGIHTLPDGTVLEAATHATTSVQHGTGVAGGEAWDTVNFTTTFSATPMVLAQIQTMANESGTPPGGPSIPWLTVAMQNVSTTSLDLALERSEVNDGGAVSSNEAIAYVVIDAAQVGNFIDNASATINYETILSSDSIQGWDNGCFTTNFSGTYAAAPHAIATSNRHDGGDGGWIRRCSLTNTAIGLTYDEDIFRDTERNHTTEAAGILLFSQAFDAEIVLIPYAEWRMDEAAWSGIVNEVVDSSGNNYHGTASNATTVAGILCNAADLSANSTSDYLSMNNSAMSGLTNFTVTFWGRTSNTGNMAGLSGARAGQANEIIFWFPNSTTATPYLGGTAVGNIGISNIADNNWHHFAWTRNANTHCIYMDGTLRGCATAGSSAAITIDANGLIIGQEQDSVGGSFDINQDWEGLIDEYIIFDRTLGLAEIQGIRNNHLAGNNIDGTPRVCVIVDHFDINHDGNAINCQAEPVTIEAHLADHSVDASYVGTINLSTSTNRGDWTIITGNGPLNNGGANDGAATYTYVVADNGVVVLGLKDTTVETLNIDVSDGVVTESSGSALASEDNDLSFAEAGFEFRADGVANTIGTQIAGKDSDVAPGVQTLELYAIRTSDSSGACEAALVNNVNIDLAFECLDPTNCTARQVAINGSNIAGNNAGPIAAYTAVPLDFGNASDFSAAFNLNYPDVGSIRLHARYDIPLEGGSPSGVYMFGASNAFVVRPFGFYVTATANPAASSAAGPAYRQAGVNFSASASAVLWSAADDADTNGVPDGYGDSDPGNNANLSNNTVALNYGQESATESVLLAANLWLPSPGSNPGLAGTTTISSFTNGAGSSSVNYPEVGIIELTANVADASYLGVGSVSGRSTYVGRFIPHHFSVSAGDVTHRVDRLCAPPSTFTYLEEIFRLEFTLTAENLANATTDNYTGAFAKLDLGTIANLNIGALDAAGPTNLTARLNNDSSSGIWSNGSANVLARTALQRGVAVDGPFPSLNVGVAPLEVDGAFNITLGSYNLDVDIDTVNDHGLVTVVNTRFGRLFLESNYGTERLPLRLPLYAEYYAGAQFVRNLSDSCTDYHSAAISFSNRQDLPADPIPSGSGTLMIGNYDALNPILLDSNDNAGSVDVTLDVPSYLEFDWNSDGIFDNDPTSKATFGIFHGSGNQIYIREVY